MLPYDFYIQFTGLTKEFPSNIHLLTLQSLGSDSYLLRLDHQYEADESPFNEPFELSLAVSALSSPLVSSSLLSLALSHSLSSLISLVTLFLLDYRIYLFMRSHQLKN